MPNHGPGRGLGSAIRSELAARGVDADRYHGADACFNGPPHCDDFCTVGTDAIADETVTKSSNTSVVIPEFTCASGVLTCVEACIPALRRYAVALLRNRQDVDDLVQECLVRALDKLHTWRDDADVRPWLFAIMHNVFINALRRAKARPNGEPMDETHETAMTMHGNQESYLEWQDTLRALNQLPIEQRTIILLVSVEDLSYAEAAHVLDIPVGTVMSRLARGRERLRQLTHNCAVRSRAHPPGDA
jgi:RNA polymerase sigma-70 factor (ECF subfamily)